jgi:hypothetical protein
MNATPDPHGPVDPVLDEYEYEDDGFAETLPVRPKRPFLTKWSAALMSLMLAAVGFFVGVRVEKAKIPSSSGGASAFASALAGATGKGGTGRAGAAGAAGGFASRFAGGAAGAGGFGGAAGNDTIGSVSSVNGKTIYVTETSGDTVKVKLTGQTTITKSESVKSSKVFPGDEVVIAGSKASGGTVDATTLTDSGARSTGSTTSGSTGSNASSAVSSLFGS